MKRILNKAVLLTVLSALLLEASGFAMAQQRGGRRRTDRHHGGSAYASETFPTFTMWSRVDPGALGRQFPGLEFEPVAGGGFNISGLPTADLGRFAAAAAALAANNRQPRPRFGAPGQGDPGDQLSEEAARFLRGVVGAGLGLLEADGRIKGGPVPGDGGGRWVKVCPEQKPCVMPTPPTPPHMEDCGPLADDRDQKADDLADANKRINQLERLLWEVETAHQGLSAIGSMLTAGIAIMTVYAIMTSPIGATATAAMLLAEVSIAKELIDYLGGLLVDGIAYLTVSSVKNAIADAVAARDEARAAYDAALGAWAECMAANAETAAAHSAAFETFITETLPKYYECLDRNKCRWVWQPN